MSEQCQTFCIQQMVDSQYNAMANIYNKFNGYLIGVIAFFVIYALLDASIKASEKGFWRINYIIGNKDIPFRPSEDTVKIIKFIKGLLFGLGLAMSLVYYIIYGAIAGMGY